MQDAIAAPVHPLVIRPFYDRAGITLYCGDARELIEAVPMDSVLISDPPYGVGLGVAKDARRNGHGLGKGAYRDFADDYETWKATVPPVLTATLQRVKRGAVFTGPHLQEQPKADAIGGVYCPAGAGRHSWGFKTFLPVLFYGTAPALNKGAKPNTIQSTETADANGHPCPKPIGWMKWLIAIAAEPGDVIVDPFAGSGTTLVAAKLCGHRAIGFEISEEYCRIAESRLRQGVLFPCSVDSVSG